MPMPGSSSHRRCAALPSSQVPSHCSTSGNWYLAFGAEQALNLMGSLAPPWSLSVEEQFDLLWPIVLIGLLATSIQWWRLAIIMGAGALAASAWRSLLW